MKNKIALYALIAALIIFSQIILFFVIATRIKIIAVISGIPFSWPVVATVWLTVALLMWLAGWKTWKK